MILACGEALIDMIPCQTARGEDAFLPCPGGAVFNTALALGRLGVPAGLFSGLSRDLFGDMLRDRLAASGVDYSLATLSDRPTTLAFVRLEQERASYTFHDENTAGRMLTLADLPPVTAEALFFGGISLMVEPCGSAYEALMLREAPTRPCMIDPNIRPALIADPAAYRARIARMMAAADIVKLSDEDLHWLEGPGDIPALARGVLDRGAHLVCVTQGAMGAAAYSADHAVFVPAGRVDVVDTVGAGDTFNAGLLASLHRAGALTKRGIAALDKEVLRAALDLGVRAAAVTVTRAGANPPWTREL